MCWCASMCVPSNLDLDLVAASPKHCQGVEKSERSVFSRQLAHMLRLGGLLDRVPMHLGKMCRHGQARQKVDGDASARAARWHECRGRQSVAGLLA
jgi:hypothetical protein